MLKDLISQGLEMFFWFCVVVFILGTFFSGLEYGTIKGSNKPSGIFDNNVESRIVKDYFKADYVFNAHGKIVAYNGSEYLGFYTVKCDFKDLGFMEYLKGYKNLDFCQVIPLGVPKERFEV